MLLHIGLFHDATTLRPTDPLVSNFPNVCTCIGTCVVVRVGGNTFFPLVLYRSFPVRLVVSSSFLGSLLLKIFLFLRCCFIARLLSATPRQDWLVSCRCDLGASGDLAERIVLLIVPGTSSMPETSPYSLISWVSSSNFVICSTSPKFKLLILISSVVCPCASVASCVRRGFCTRRPCSGPKPVRASACQTSSVGILHVFEHCHLE